jgi:hypothetical protein
MIARAIDMEDRARQPGSCAKRMRVRPLHAHAPERHVVR